MCSTRLIPCEHCDGTGRDWRETGEFSRFDGSMIGVDCGPCPVCNGSLVEAIEVEAITLEDLEAAHAA